MAKAFPQAEVFAVDISDDALGLARENAARLGLDANVIFKKADLLDGIEEAFDLIVANLPYIAMADRSALSREVLHDPEVALFGGKGGDEIVRKLIDSARDHLRTGGMLALELGLGQAEALAAVMATEKNVSWGRRLSAPVGLVLVVSGIALAIAGFAGAETQQFGNVRAIVGPGPVTTSLRHGAYRLEFGIQPNRASVPNTVALRIGRAGRPVVGADITATLTMLDMSMGSQTYHLGESAAGLYRISTPALVMSGRWGISFQVRPPRRSRFDVAVLDHASG